MTVATRLGPAGCTMDIPLSTSFAYCASMLLKKYEVERDGRCIQFYSNNNARAHIR